MLRLPSRAACLAAMLLVGAVSMPAGAGQVLDRVLASKALTGAYSEGYPPVAFIDENNQLTGFDVEVGKEIAKRLGVELKPVTASWEMQVAGHWGDRLDIAVGSMTPTNERAQVLDFPGIYYYTPAAFAVHKDNTSIQKVEDLSGKTIGACAACTSELYLQGTLAFDAQGVPPFEFKVKPGKIVSYEGEGTAFDDLKLGDGVRLDAVLTNLPTLVEAIKKGEPFRIVEPPVFYEPLAVAVDKGDPEFTAKVAEIIQAMHADGMLSALSNKWFGVDLTKAAN
ncbi:MAG: transporter substrate-binding domain-containing protein [Dongiaceae bacterium]